MSLKLVFAVAVFFCFLIGVLVISNFKETNESQNGPANLSNSTFCKPEQRGVEICASVYSPVCGWFSKNIQCIKYPCAQTFSNSCSACSNPGVEYWTEGECPE